MDRKDKDDSKLKLLNISLPSNLLIINSHFLVQSSKTSHSCSSADEDDDDEDLDPCEKDRKEKERRQANNARER